MWSCAWWKDAGERAIRTFANAVLAVLGVGTTMGNLSIIDFNWPRVLGIGVLSAVVSILTSMATHAIGKNGPGIYATPKSEE